MEADPENMLNSTFTSQFQVDGYWSLHTTSSMSLVRNSNNGGSPYLTLGKNSTSVNGAGLVSSGDGILGVISFQLGDSTPQKEQQFLLR